MADGAGGKIDARHLAHVWVIAEWISQARVAVQHVGRDIAELGENREQTDGRMTLAHQEAVAVRPFRVCRKPHHVVIECREDFGGGKYRRVMSDFRDFDEPDRFQPHELRPVAQPRDFGIGRSSVVSDRLRHSRAPIPF